MSIVNKNILEKIIIIFIIVLNSRAYSQEIPKEYELFAKIEHPKDLKWALADEILIDSAKQYIIIAYDYKPTYLEFYKLPELKFMARVVVKGHAYLYESYFDKQSGSVYVAFGNGLSKYMKIDLSNFSKEKVHCKNAPLGCDFYPKLEQKPVYFNVKVDEKFNYSDYFSVTDNGWYFLKSYENYTEVYLKP